MIIVVVLFYFIFPMLYFSIFLLYILVTRLAFLRIINVKRRLTIYKNDDLRKTFRDFHARVMCSSQYLTLISDSEIRLRYIAKKFIFVVFILYSMVTISYRDFYRFYFLKSGLISSYLVTF